MVCKKSKMTKKGFTLTEVIVVVAIIVILAGAGITGIFVSINDYNRYRQDLEENGGYHFEADAHEAVENMLKGAGSPIPDNTSFPDPTEITPTPTPANDPDPGDDDDETTTTTTVVQPDPTTTQNNNNGGGTPVPPSNYSHSTDLFNWGNTVAQTTVNLKQNASYKTVTVSVSYDTPINSVSMYNGWNATISPDGKTVTYTGNYDINNSSYTFQSRTSLPGGSTVKVKDVKIYYTS
ncbi:MAG: prepilin-type N-terminal cleavage/methylation domain-containing protein [Clostridiales bacterium]|nr:prepilin-type N-terminal cleavage/methylation domain-containing protein [Clostridiales bacterium]